jgi:hypothetical protein
MGQGYTRVAPTRACILSPLCSIPRQQMGRLLVMCLTAAVGLELCDDPVGPQPDQPIKPPPGYAGEPPPPTGGPPQPKPTAPAQAAEAPAEKAAPAPEPPKCPADIGTLLIGKVKASKDKKKQRLKLELGAKAGGPTITYRKLVKAEDGQTEEPKLEGATLTAFLIPFNPKGKVRLTVLVACGWEDRNVAVTVDPKGLAVTMKEIPPPPEPGFLNVSAEAGVKVTASGRELGVTPLRNVPLPPGKYQLTLQPKKGKPKTVAVEIKSAQTSNVDLDAKKK